MPISVNSRETEYIHSNQFPTDTRKFPVAQWVEIFSSQTFFLHRMPKVLILLKEDLIYFLKSGLTKQSCGTANSNWMVLSFQLDDIQQLLG